MTNEQELIAEIIELKSCLIDMLEQFGANYSMSSVEDACALLKHPRTKYLQPKPIKKSSLSFLIRNVNDCCYCRNVVYCKKEASRRRKLKLNFVDKTNDK
jgi:hypothetical protein